MVIPARQQGYSVAQGTSPIPAFIFQPRDPTENDTTPNYVLYSAWVNTITKGIWYLEEFLCSNAVITSQWRAVAPIVVSSVGPASPLTSSSDYSYPIGQTWCDKVLNDYYVMTSNPTDTTGYWIKLSAGGQGVDLLEGNSGGPVGPDTNGIIHVIGAAGEIDIVGTPLNNTLTVSLIGGSTAIDSIDVDAHTAPGTDPVLPDSNGLITVTGGQVAAGTTTNVIRTDSLAANTYTIEIQRSSAQATTTIGANGVSHFDNNSFSVDANGFVKMNNDHIPFTPTIYGSTSAGTATYISQNGAYSVLGAIVIAQFDLSWTGHTGTGNMMVAGFPTILAAANSNYPFATKIQNITLPAGTKGIVVNGINNTTTAGVISNQDAAPNSPVQMSADGALAFMAVYLRDIP